MQPAFEPVYRSVEMRPQARTRVFPVVGACLFRVGTTAFRASAFVDMTPKRFIFAWVLLLSFRSPPL